MWRVILSLLLLMCSAISMAAKDSSDDDRIRFGRPIVVENGTSVDGDVVCIACPIINRGAIRGDAVSILGPIENRGSIGGDGAVIVGSMHNDGEIGGDAAVIVGSLNVGPTGVVGKDATVVMGNANVAPGATVHGKFERSMIGGSAIALLLFIPLTIGVVLAIVLALICYSVAGQARIAIVADSVRRKPGLSFLAGLCAIVVFLFALWAFGHMHPISGLLVVAACIALVAMMIIGYTGLSFAIGNRLGNTSPVAAVVIGAIVIAVAQAIPVLQFVFGFALLMFALGAAALTGFGTHPEWIQDRIGSQAAPR
jgi:hypothetical protein